jgi:XTP/dITP diphosphohydrolase
MKQLVIATNNKHKVEEISKLAGKNIHLLTLKDIGCNDEIPEDQDTLEGNAYQKALFIYDKFGYDCFADDTGLEVDALNGEPGVYSARYSKDEAPEIPEEKRSEYNIIKLLRKLQNKDNRKAAFRTSICLVENGKALFFEGKVEGHIINERHGKMGFGYDPVFVPNGYSKTFAEMDLDEKNKISHRSLATNKLLKYLNENTKS